MAQEKVVNYTPELAQEIVAQYQLGTSVEALAVEHGKSVRSIVAKLSREGVYQAKSKAKQESGRVTKQFLVMKIERAIGAEPGSLFSLEKATQGALQAVFAAVEQDAFEV